MAPGQYVALVRHADRVALRGRQLHDVLPSEGFHQPRYPIPRIAGAVAELPVAIGPPAKDRAPLCDHRGVPVGRRDPHGRAHLPHAPWRRLRVHARVTELAVPVGPPREDQAPLADRRRVVLGSRHREHAAAGREARPHAAGRDHRDLPAVHVELGVAEAPPTPVAPGPQAPAVQCAAVELPPRDGRHRAAPEALDPRGRLLHAPGARAQLKVRPIPPSHDLPAQPRPAFACAPAPAEQRPELFPQQVQGGPALRVGRLCARAARQELPRERQAPEEEGAVQDRPPALRAPLGERRERRARPQGREQRARPLGACPPTPPPRRLPQRPRRGPQPQRPAPAPAPAPRPAHPRGPGGVGKGGGGWPPRAGTGGGGRARGRGAPRARRSPPAGGGPPPPGFWEAPEFRPSPRSRPMISFTTPTSKVGGAAVGCAPGREDARVRGRPRGARRAGAARRDPARRAAPAAGARAAAGGGPQCGAGARRAGRPGGGLPRRGRRGAFE